VTGPAEVLAEEIWLAPTLIHLDIKLLEIADRPSAVAVEVALALLIELGGGVAAGHGGMAGR
jgi:hypothetical protein